MKRRTMFGIAAGLTTLLVGAGAVAVGAHAGRSHVMKRFVSSSENGRERGCRVAITIPRQ